jgi:outer membrane biosynthesis protein TonB
LAQRIALESLLIRITKLGVGVSIDTVLEKLAALESGLALGAAPPPTADPPDAGAPANAPAAPAIARRPEPTLAPIVVPKAEPVAVQPKPAPEQAKPAPEKPAAEKPEPIAPKPEAPKPEPAPAKPVAEVAVVPSGVTSNPLVADVIDVFKGHVVAVRSVE